MNIVIAFVILFVLALQRSRSRPTLAVDEVEPGTPAARAARAGDELVSVDGVSAATATSSAGGALRDQIGDPRLRRRADRRLRARRRRRRSWSSATASAVDARRSRPYYDAESRAATRLGFALRRHAAWSHADRSAEAADVRARPDVAGHLADRRRSSPASSTPSSASRSRASSARTRSTRQASSSTPARRSSCSP